MIKNKQDLELFLREDRMRNLHCEEVNLFKYYALLLAKSDNYMAYRYLKALRKFEYSYNCQKGKGMLGNIIFLIRKFYLYRLSANYNVTIEPNVTGYGLYLPHIIGGGIAIRCKSMGNYCVVNTGVLIGKKDKDEEKPIIGNNVEINTGAVIFGCCNIGDNAKIAPNTVVFKDVPSNGVVSGVPAKLLKIITN